MPTTIATTAQATPLGQPSHSLIARHPTTGHLWSVVKSGVDTWSLYKSTDGGTTWTSMMSQTRANVVETSGLIIGGDGFAYWAFRTNESSQDRIYTQRMAIGTVLQWGSQVLLSSVGNGGVAGAIYTGLDLQMVNANNLAYVAVAVGTTSGSKHGVTLLGETINSSSQTTVTTAIFSGTRQWLATGSGRITPSIDIETSGGFTTNVLINPIAGGTSGPSPHLWLSWGRTTLYMAKCSWTGSAWSGPTSATTVLSGLGAQDAITGRWDGERWLMAVPDPSTTDTVRLIERDRANSRTTVRTSPAHPTGVVRNCAVTFNQVNKDARIYAIGTSSTVLHYVDYVRASNSWTSWATVSATAVLGATGNQYSVRRGSSGNAKHDVLTAHSGSPNTVVHTPQTLTYAPNVPTWDAPAIGYTSGAGADVSAVLNLDWTFSDPDPGDAQTAWALSRQIGVGTLAYFRASDSTWQAAEVKNVGATTSRTLAAAWGLSSDAPHSYKVKVWDGADTASLYSEAFVVVPSGKVNPTITAPTPDGTTITTGQVTTTWTVAEQSAYRVRLLIFGSLLFDSGWRSGAASSFDIPHDLGNGFGYTIRLNTRNLEGLASDDVNRNFFVEFVPPTHAAVVLTPMPNLGVIRAVITTPAPVGSQPAVADVQLMRRPFKNPYIKTFNFETAGQMAEWGAPHAGADTRTNAKAHEGSWSYQLISNGADPLGSYLESVKFPATPGITYFLDAFITASTAAKDVLVQLRWYDAGGAFVSAFNGLGDPVAAVNDWAYRWVSGTCPANATQMTLCAVLDSIPANGDTIWVDEVRVRETDHTPHVRVAADLPPNSTYDDWRVVSGVDYEYRVEVRGVNGTGVGGVWTN